MKSTTTLTAGAIVLEVLNEHNYKEWSARVKTYMLSKDLWDVVEDEPPEEEKGSAECKARKIKNARALHAINISCGTEAFSSIQEIDLAKKAWEVLGRKFKFRSIDTFRTDNGGNDLHMAVRKGNVHDVKNLLSSMTEEQVLQIDGNGYTALDGCIVAANEKIHQNDRIQIAKALVGNNLNIVKISSRRGYIPIVRAASLSNWEMVHYLYPLTKDECFLGDNERQGAHLMNMCIWRPEGLDVAWGLLQKHPRLAMADNGYKQQAMLVLAGIRSAYPSPARLSIWRKLIYKGIRIRQIEFCIPGFPDSRITVSESEGKPSPDKRSIADEVSNLFREAIMGTSRLLGFHDVYKIKENHLRFEKFLSGMVEEIEKLGTLTTVELNVLRASIFRAIAQGHVEFVKQMYKSKPDVVDIFDDKNKSIFQYAIECRQENIYNLIYELGKEKRGNLTHKVAKFNTNLLHSAASISLTKQPEGVQGASLQMQRELQWFKEVESMLPSEMHEDVNTSNLTAQELFIKNHKELKDEAETSTKGVAASCTTIGALIVTMMFAAAFAVPGGTDGNTGLPFFLHTTLFKIYIVADTISLVSSATSVITFLGLLTSTYAEDDFLWSLPTKMAIGLSTLFISIMTMMITFACALTIMLERDTRMIITGITLSTLPVVTFAFFLFPLLYEICRWTYGPSRFGKKASIWVKVINLSNQ